MPITIKENIATKGVPVPLGTAATELVPAAADAPPAARVREAGAIILAKTTMPDYGMLSSGLSSFHPLSRNPWDVRKGPGGSSAGGGAAAAAGYGPLHIGTDIGGSLRLPASWCGIFSLKPSLGRIPIDPPYTGRAAGPMTRTVADAALMMQVLSQPDVRDSMSLPAQDIAWGQFNQGAERLRGVEWARGAIADTRTVDALLRTVRYDPNLNVRLAAIDALGGALDSPDVGVGLIEAFEQQDSPLLQVMLASLLLDGGVPGADDAVQRVLERDELDPLVREYLQSAIDEGSDRSTATDA